MVPVNAAEIPDLLRERPRWVGWTLEEQEDRVTKVPRIADDPTLKASTNDPATWRPFDTALRTYLEGTVDGVGFVLGGGIFGIDLDHCLDQASGKLEPWAREIVDRLSSYTEISPSGMGVHIIASGQLPPGGRRSGRIEMYEAGRYFTVTGNRVPGSPASVEERTEAARLIHEQVFAKRTDGQTHGKRRESSKAASSAGLSDDELIAKAKAAKNGEKFQRLWAGDFGGYDSQSEADLALCCLLAVLTGGDGARVDRLFRLSGLFRSKWDQPHRSDGTTYGQQTVEKALETETADPPPEEACADLPYRDTASGLIYIKQTANGPVSIRLTNFAARIVVDRAEDDGAEVRRVFDLDVSLAGRTRRITVLAASFSSMAWVTESLGARAIVYPGFTNREHTRAAIQFLSSEVVEKIVYRHTGWRRGSDGGWVYLHGDGAIGAGGIVDGVQVELPEALLRYQLPAPPAGTELRDAVRASLRLVDVAPDHISVPLLLAPYRAALGSGDFSLHLSGPTGIGKTELAALAQQHYGPGMDARHLPGSWSSTANALEGAAFAAKDALFVVDDFAPGGSLNDLARLHREADRLFRNQGNAAGRARMRSDGTLRPPRPPRGLLVSTGEDSPRGQSVRARILVLEVGHQDVNWTCLTSCQGDAAAGTYALSMAGFLQWLAPGYDQMRTTLKSELTRGRFQGGNGEGHRRTSDIETNLIVALTTFLTFAQNVGACTADEAAELLRRGKTALATAAANQQSHQVASDPACRFLDLLRAALASGRAHVAKVDGSRPPRHELWGWIDVDEYSHAQGDRVGWLDGDDLFLEPEAAFACAQSMGTRTGEPITVSGHTLRRRLRDRGVLISTDTARHVLTMRRTIQGVRRDVLHLRASTLQEGPPPERRTGQKPHGPKPPTTPA